jgi:hypothetical protein
MHSLQGDMFAFEPTKLHLKEGTMMTDGRRPEPDDSS